MTTPPPSTVRQATILLLLTTLLWGLSFPLVKSWQLAAGEKLGGELPASLTLIALRMLPALAILCAAQPRLLLSTTRREYARGAMLGLVFFVGFVPQMCALGMGTSPAMSAFITSLGSAWAPLLGWALLGMPVTGLMLAGLVVAVGGVAVLSFTPTGGGLYFGAGEWLTLASSLIFGSQILLLDRLGKGVRTAHLSTGFFGVSGLLALVLAVAWAAGGQGVGPWLSTTGELLGRRDVFLTVAALVLLPTVLSFHWMNTYQPRVPATRAALIYLLEPPFAAALSIPWGYDELTGRLLIGGGLVLAGNLLVEMRGLWKGERGVSTP